VIARTNTVPSSVAWVVVAWVVVAGCAPVVPAHVADVVVTERLTQRFSVSDKADPVKAEAYYALVGRDAAEVLATVEPHAVTGAQGGKLEGRGELVLTARLNPHDPTHYAVEGHGNLGVYLGDRLLILTDLRVGSSDLHALGELRTKVVVLPIRHFARLNPALLLAHAKLRGSECVIHTEAPNDRDVACMARGVGSPYDANYYVSVHLTELVPGQVYSVDREREHEVFRETEGGLQVFGCVRFDTASAAKLLDVRSQSLVSPLRGGAPAPPAPAYVSWRVPASCSSEVPAGPRGAEPADEPT
jgi:hypothetical protein